MDAKLQALIDRQRDAAEKQIVAIEEQLKNTQKKIDELLAEKKALKSMIKTHEISMRRFGGRKKKEPKTQREEKDEIHTN